MTGHVNGARTTTYVPNQHNRNKAKKQQESIYFTPTAVANSEKREVHTTKVILFDMDGTLVDSNAVVEKAWKSFAIRHNLDVKTVIEASHGIPAIDTIKLFAQSCKSINVEKEIAQITEEHNSTIGIVAIPGAKELLTKLPKDRWAIVTSSHRELALSRMQLTELPIPDIFITLEDVAPLLGKPLPFGYAIAAELLGARPDECIVFEDAPAGVEAALTAKMRTIIIGDKSVKMESACIQRISDFSKLNLTFRDDGHLQLQLEQPQYPKNMVNPRSVRSKL